MLHALVQASNTTLHLGLHHHGHYCPVTEIPVSDHPRLAWISGTQFHHYIARLRVAPDSTIAAIDQPSHTMLC